MILPMPRRKERAAPDRAFQTAPGRPESANRGTFRTGSTSPCDQKLLTDAAWQHFVSHPHTKTHYIVIYQYAKTSAPAVSTSNPEGLAHSRPSEPGLTWRLPPVQRPSWSRHYQSRRICRFPLCGSGDSVSYRHGGEDYHANSAQPRHSCASAMPQCPHAFPTRVHPASRSHRPFGRRIRATSERADRRRFLRTMRAGLSVPYSL